MDATSNEDLTPGQRFAFVIGTIVVCSILIYIVGKPLWRDIMAATQVENDANAGNAYLSRKQQQQSRTKNEETQHSARDESKASVEEEETADSTANHNCWGCGAQGHSYKACSLCVESKMDMVCRFCSPECLRSNWPRHKQWHAAQADRNVLEEAMRAAEQNAQRISVPAKRETKRKTSAATALAGNDTGGTDAGGNPLKDGAGGKGSTGQGSAGHGAGEDDAQLQRAVRQQAERERTQLAAAFRHLCEQIERDNKGAMAASRHDFGRLVKQIDDLLQEQHGAAEVDALFADFAEGEDGRVDLRAFLHAPRAVEWFLSTTETTSSPAKAVKPKADAEHGLRQRARASEIDTLD